MAKFDPAKYTQYDAIVDKVAQETGVSQSLIKAVIMAESGFNPRAYRAEPQINDASYGLMQLLYRTARGLGYSRPPEGLYDPATNIRLGATYLSHLLRRFGGDERLAVAGYNCGGARVANLRRRYGPRFDDIEPRLPEITRRYVPRVMAYREAFAAYHREHGLRA